MTSINHLPNIDGRKLLGTSYPVKVLRENLLPDTIRSSLLPQATKKECLCWKPLQFHVYSLEDITVHIIAFLSQTGHKTHKSRQKYPCPSPVLWDQSQASLEPFGQSLIEPPTSHTRRALLATAPHTPPSHLPCLDGARPCACHEARPRPWRPCARACRASAIPGHVLAAKPEPVLATAPRTPPNCMLVLTATSSIELERTPAPHAIP